MLDVAVVTLVVLCFVLARAYASLCDHLLALAANQDIAP
jgi:hypothetical protein